LGVWNENIQLIKRVVAKSDYLHFFLLCILTYFDVLITKMIVKVGANLIFMVKII